MARSDQTQTAVLGALSIMPMSGYALREEIKNTLGHFWSESFGQIYPALAELQRAGLVERRDDAAGRSSSYDITPAGTARLRELLAEPPQPNKPRNGVLLRLFFGRQLGPDACRRLVLEAQAQAETQLAAMREARTELAGGKLGDNNPYALITVSAGERSARATIDWARDALAILDALDVLDEEPVTSPPATGT
ncbi:DNA-binding PadR family transcriptional regulator [Arthrobacter sp. V4I6]|uniref:PadR family transcriptional regulator n=1 Tax=unclassified Arthrobacter TaxID=235627 RepID=UPI002783338F|nr:MULTISPECIES: PadR family transcriptional regulator [unclassified Arthrobacter]MDQ0822523.1 DNA-binding PadR family transcriptional regulator [Arthrobacter sp. V1I7]MDQ0852150.1 DNA-binding PadR family transcriptional regulator [Arthrobacter sp. V4I6]